MRNSVVIRVLSALLALWYVFVTVGFDIHRSADTRSAYILPMFVNLSCESIHPDAPCCHQHCCCEGCCHDEDSHHCDEDEDCCTDTYEQLSALSVITESAPVVAPAVSNAIMGSEPVIASSVLTASTGSVPVNAPGPPPDILSSICMLRA